VSKLEDALWEADAALKRCKPDQGRVARSNGRKLMLRALHKARAALDAEFPVIPKTKRPRRTRTVRQRLRGKTKLGPNSTLKLVRAGVSPSQFLTLGSEDLGDPPGESITYAPSWMVRALRADLPPKLIAEAVRSQKKRRQINATLRLSGRGKTP
jgi:hypothetical protein